jgi:cellulose biosynthesis protein BcsQ
MTGRLQEFRLADVLQAVGTTPQCTAIELRRDDGSVQGTIWLEAGRVIDAERGEVRGRDAFYDLFGVDTADVFVVSRLAAPPGRPGALGPVAGLLLELLDRPPPLASGSQIAPLVARFRMPSRDGIWDEETVARPVRRAGVTLAVASTRGGVGRTTVALHLGRAFARAGRRALLIDAGAGGDLADLTGVSGVHGVDELVADADAIDGAIRDPLPGLRVLAVAADPGPDAAAAWRTLVVRARSRADVVVVDCPAGVTGVGADVVAACSHVVGVVRSDRGSTTAAAMVEAFVDGIAGLELAGVVVNLFDGRSPPSLEAFQRIAAHGAPLFETTIPRADALAEPPCGPDPGPIGWLFDALGAEVIARTGLVEPAAVAALGWLPR